MSPMLPECPNFVWNAIFLFQKRTAFPEERRSPSRHTGLPSVHLDQSERVKPVSTRLPRLVARGCPAAVLGHFVRDTCLRRIHPHDKPFFPEWSWE
jgi:hypothetical protein